MKLENVKSSVRLVRNDTRNEVIKTFIELFKNHIGAEQAISSEELFFKITGVSPGGVDYYEREYKWNAIKRLLGVLRKDGTIFVVMGTRYHYVLNSSEELYRYKKKIDATIKGLNKMKVKAEKWLDSDSLKQLKQTKMITNR